MILKPLNYYRILRRSILAIDQITFEFNVSWSEIEISNNEECSLRIAGKTGNTDSHSIMAIVIDIPATPTQNDYDTDNL